ncbi:helix-turn-helix domain-containing protein [uncultured Algibacter sp.]|uniref:helix-turn-helix domain-containing protein n=1 Tax=uncultured Algibacter sp. TaxID=298659 RepID=UPI0026311830|nr:helix-turn-helix domain-containing protein [uncultured Algibacter sp.]
MPENKKNYDHQFTKIYKKVKSAKNLSELEKLILSEIISYQMHGRYFYMTNDSLSLEFGCSPKRIQTAISNLNPILHKEHYYPVPPEGGRPKKRRKLLVKNLVGIIPQKVLLEMNIDIEEFKTIEDFIKWAKLTLVTSELITAFLELNPIIEKKLGKI